MKVSGSWIRDGNLDNEFSAFIEMQGDELRDFFAAFALSGLARLYPQGGDSFANLIAPMAYEIADAMMEARQKKATG